MIRRPPRSTRTDTLFPYTTLFRSTGFDQQGRSCTGQEGGAATLRRRPSTFPTQTMTDIEFINDWPQHLRRVSSVDPSNILAVALFGSRARGDSSPDSDIDLLMITPTRLRRSDERRVGNECVSTCRSRCSPYN